MTAERCPHGTLLNREARMIGQLHFPAGAQMVTATLNDDLTWLCEDTEWTTVLNAQFPVSVGSTSSARFALYRAAERLAGRVQVQESPTEPVG